MEWLWKRSPRGTETDDEGTIAPKWTCREAVAVIAAMKAAALDGGVAFPQAYQFAAVAYGWSPDAGGLDNSTSQGDAIYPPYAAVALNLEMQRIFDQLDARHRATPPRLNVIDVFDSSKFQTEVQDQLKHDGASASFKIPIPACKDPKTGRPAWPVRGPDGKWKCPGGIVTIDDPLTSGVKSLGPIVLIAAAAYAYLKFKPRRSRRW